MAAAHQHHRMVGRNAVELGRERQPLLAQLRLVPVRIAHDQLAGLGLGGGGADCRQQVRDRARRRQVDAVAAALVVEMPVGEPRRDEAAAERR